MDITNMVDLVDDNAIPYDVRDDDNIGSKSSKFDYVRNVPVAADNITQSIEKLSSMMLDFLFQFHYMTKMKKLVDQLEKDHTEDGNRISQVTGGQYEDAFQSTVNEMFDIHQTIHGDVEASRNQLRVFEESLPTVYGNMSRISNELDMARKPFEALTAIFTSYRAKELASRLETMYTKREQLASNLYPGSNAKNSATVADSSRRQSSSSSRSKQDYDDNIRDFIQYDSDDGSKRNGRSYEDDDADFEESSPGKQGTKNKNQKSKGKGSTTNSKAAAPKSGGRGQGKGNMSKAAEPDPLQPTIAAYAVNNNIMSKQTDWLEPANHSASKRRTRIMDEDEELFNDVASKPFVILHRLNSDAIDLSPIEQPSLPSDNLRGMQAKFDRFVANNPDYDPNGNVDDYIHNNGAFVMEHRDVGEESLDFIKSTIPLIDDVAQLKESKPKTPKRPLNEEVDGNDRTSRQRRASAKDTQQGVIDMTGDN